MQAGPVRYGAILCALCLVITGAGAFGAPLRTSSSPVGTPATAKRVHGANPQVILLGHRAIEPAVDHNFVGTVEAFAFRARRTGTAASISVYLDARNRAHTLFAGLYSSRDGRPRTLLTSGLRRSLRAGAWNSVAVRWARVRSGTTYWLVVLGKGGAVYFRDRRSCSGDRSAKRSMRSLPMTWPHGRNSRVCLISAYVKGAKGSGGTKVLGPHAPSGTSGTGTGGGPSPVNTTGPYFTASSGTTLSCSNGCAVVGQTLGVNSGVWTNSPSSFRYKWERCTTTSAQPPSTGSCSAIGGATSSVYTVGSADVGHSLVPVVTASNGAGASSPTSLAGTCNTGEMLGVTAGSYFANSSSVPTSVPAGCSPISAVVGATQASEKFCTNAVTTCGYADPLNQTVGVPAGVTPSTTGACAAYTNGARISSGTVTINGCKITGQIYVSGGTVTVENSDLSVNDEGGAGAPIEAHGGTVIAEYDTIHGLGPTPSGSMAWAIYDCCGSPAATVDHVFVYNADRIFMNLANSSQTPTVTNSYCWSNAEVKYSGTEEHAECIYTQPPASLTLKNTTLINWRDQTAANFVDDNTGSPGSVIDLENNLLMGGDYCVYGGGNYANSDTYISNRFSRALYSNCALFGPSASGYDAPSITDSGNIWDNTGASLSP